MIQPSVEESIRSGITAIFATTGYTIRRMAIAPEFTDQRLDRQGIPLGTKALLCCDHLLGGKRISP